MSETDWLNLIPSAMSAIAALAAAVAAFRSLSVSRESKEVSRLSALAIHHGPASKTLAESIETLNNKLKPLSDIGYNVWVEWASDIQKHDIRESGGKNPRPLRHVLSNASEMLATHSTEKGKRYRHAPRSMFCIVREGINDLSDIEYKRLLERADGEHSEFEYIFGYPEPNKCISKSMAFRWANYQLIKRVPSEQWLIIWKEAWSKSGWLSKYLDEHSKIMPVLQSVRETLSSERSALAHSAFPLAVNESLHGKYNKILEIVDVLLDDCGLDVLSRYREELHVEYIIPLIIYSMGIAFLSTDIIENALYQLQETY